MSIYSIQFESELNQNWIEFWIKNISIQMIQFRFMNQNIFDSLNLNWIERIVFLRFLNRFWITWIAFFQFLNQIWIKWITLEWFNESLNRLKEWFLNRMNLFFLILESNLNCSNCSKMILIFPLIYYNIFI